jgi:hypothetical protein
LEIAFQFGLNHELLLVLRDDHRIAFESSGQVVGLPFVQDPHAGKIVLGCPDRDGAEAEHGRSYNAENYFRLSHP